MSEQKKNTSAVDWAEKLKASMENTPDEPRTSSDAGVEDDLAALLRAQLGMSQQPQTYEDALDTAEFDTEEEFEEEAEEEFEEDSEEEFEEDSEDEFEEESEDEFEEEAEEEFEKDSEEEFEEEPEEEFEEEPEEEFEEETEEEFEEETEEEFEEEAEEEFEEESAEDYEEETDEDYEENADEDYEDSVEESEEEPLAAAADVAEQAQAPRSFVESVQYLSDDRLNGLSFEERMGGARLRSLDEENTRILNESRPVMPWDAEPPEAPSVSLSDGERGEASPMQAPTAVSTASGERESGEGRENIRLRDSLQVDLDSFLPPVTPLKKAKHPEPAAIPAAESLSDGNGEGASVAYAPCITEDSEAHALQDTAVCLELGYGAELRAREPERVEKVLEGAEPGGDAAPGTDGEYGGLAHTEAMERRYAKARRMNLLYIGLACLGTLWALLYDLLPLLPALQSPEALWNTPYYAPIGLAVSLVLCLPFMTRFARGIKGILTFEPTLYSVSALSMTVALLYGGFACYVADPRKAPLLFGCAWLTAAVAALADLWVCAGERRAFAVASSGKPTFMLTDEPTPASEELAKVRAESTEDGATARPAKVLTAVRADRVADYTARTNKYNPYAGRWNYLLPAALLAAILCAGAALLWGEEPVTDGIRAFTVALLLCMPSAYAVALALPLHRVNDTMQFKGAAVLGTAAPADYAATESATILFPDGDAVKALHRMEITLRSDPRAAECRRMADVVFRMLQMPLGVEPTLGERSLEGYRIRIAEAEDGYLRLYLTRTDTEIATEIMMGTHNALTRRGVRLPKINMEQRYKKNEKCHVVYLAFDRSFRLAYAAEYRVGLTFARGVSTLAEMGQSAAIYTYDPMVSGEIEGISLLQKRNGICVLSPVDFEGIRKTRSSGVIATGRYPDLLYPLAACRAMKKAYRRGLLLSWLTLPVGMAVTLLSLYLGRMDFLTTLPVALWQIAATALTVSLTELSTCAKAIGFSAPHKGHL